jgi:hypothetical protein
MGAEWVLNRCVMFISGNFLTLNWLSWHQKGVSSKKTTSTEKQIPPVKPTNRVVDWQDRNERQRLTVEEGLAEKDAGRSVLVRQVMTLAYSRAGGRPGPPDPLVPPPLETQRPGASFDACWVTVRGLNCINLPPNLLCCSTSKITDLP